MSRFVRASKYRHVFGQSAKKEHGLENVKVTNSAWDTNIISTSRKYISINWNASGGGAFAIFPLPSPFNGHPGFPQKLPDTLPLARSHTAAVLDTDWSPHNDSIVASGGEDGKLMIWKIDGSAFDGWGTEGWVPNDFDPVARIDASPRKIGQVLFHPTASNVVASASGEHTIKLWDLENTDNARVTLSGHGDAVQSMAFNATGTLLASTCRDRKLRIFDVRAGGEAVRVAESHSGIKGARVVWMGDLDRVATTGFSRMSDRQVGIWETGGLRNVKMLSLDQSAGVVMPFYSDNNILFLAGKGDGNIRYFEYENDNLYALDEYKSSEPQRGMCFLPRRALNISDCEIARAYKVHSNSIEPIAFIVPRKAEGFQSDIFPPAPSDEPYSSAAEFFTGKKAGRNLVDLSSGVSSGASAPPPAISTSIPSSTSAPSAAAVTPVAKAAPPPEPAAPTRSNTLSAAAATALPTSPGTSPVPPSASTPIIPQTASPIPEPKAPSRAQTTDDSELKSENARLTSELREAREKIRYLEVQVEALKTNARKAADVLLGN